MPSVETDIGRLIKQHRKRAGLTQAELADATGVSPGYIGRLESDGSNPSAETLDALARALQLKPAERKEMDTLRRKRKANPVSSLVVDHEKRLTAIEETVGAIAERVEQLSEVAAAIASDVELDPAQRRSLLQMYQQMAGVDPQDRGRRQST